jgi:multiple sugar transport system permease protein
MTLTQKIIVGIGLVVLTFFLLTPVVIIVLSSFKSNLGIFKYPPEIIFVPTHEAYFGGSAAGPSQFPGEVGAFAPALDPLWLGFFLTTVFLSVASTGLALLIGLPAAYALARFEMPRKETTAFGILSVRMFPFVASTAPIWLMMSYLRLLDTYLALILIYTLFQLPYVVWLMWGFIEAVPKEISEAAELDGASGIAAFIRILIPIARTGLIVTIVFCLLAAYNDYAVASLLGGYHTETVPIALNALVGQKRVYWNVIFAVGTINLIPTLVLVFLVRKYWATGFTLGLLKG